MRDFDTFSVINLMFSLSVFTASNLIISSVIILFSLWFASLALQSHFSSLFSFPRSAVTSRHKPGGLKTAEIYSLTVLQARTQISRCQPFSEGYKQRILPCLFLISHGCWQILVIPWLQMHCSNSSFLCHMVFSVSVYAQIFLFLWGYQSLD